MLRARKFLKTVLLVFYLAASLQTPVLAAVEDEKTETRAIPRFVSIRAKEINLRTGPGERYPIDWVIRSGKGWPAQVIAEHDNWRQVKLWDGTTGWVHQAMLSPKQSAMVTESSTLLRRNPSMDASPRARVKSGAVGMVKKCEKNWCEIDFDGGKGWLPTAAFWGALSE